MDNSDNKVSRSAKNRRAGKEVTDEQIREEYRRRPRLIEALKSLDG